MSRNRRRDLVAQSSKNQDGLLYVIRTNDITYQCTSNGFTPPDYIAANDVRGVYAKFDLLVPEPGQYTITATSNSDEMYFELQFFSYDQLALVNEEKIIGNAYAYTGWRQGQYTFRIWDNDNVAGLRIVIAKGANKDQVVTSAMYPRFEIRKVE